MVEASDQYLEGLGFKFQLDPELLLSQQKIIIYTILLLEVLYQYV